MNVLTVAISIPNIQKMRVLRVAPDVDDATVYVRVEVQATAGVPYPMPGYKYNLEVRNGTSIGIRAAVAPQGSNDRVELFSAVTPTGFTDVFAAYVGATIAIRNSAVETALIAAGLMTAGAVS